MTTLKYSSIFLGLFILLNSCISNEKQNNEINWEKVFNKMAVAEKLDNQDLTNVSILKNVSMKNINHSFFTSFEVENVEISSAKKIIAKNGNSVIQIPIDLSDNRYIKASIILDSSDATVEKKLLVTVEEGVITYYDIRGRYMLRGVVYNGQLSFNFDISDELGYLKCDWEDWGQHTLNCVNDAYSNHGFISVWAVVQTAFIPQTAAAIAGACAVANFPCTE